MNTEAITVQYCIEMYERKNKAVILKDGRVAGFIYEKEDDHAKVATQWQRADGPAGGIFH